MSFENPFLHIFASFLQLPPYAFKSNSAHLALSQHLVLSLGNCHGGFLQFNLLVYIWLKTRFAE